MPALPLALAGLLGAALGASPSLDAGLAAEARSRTTEATGSPSERLAEGELAPWVKAGLSWPGVDLTLDYRPRLTVTDVGGGARALLHQGSVGGRWQADPAWLISILGAAKTGEISRYQLFSSGVAGGDPAQPFPGVASLGFRSVEGTLGLGVITGPRHQLQLTLGAADEGGASLDDQRWLPRQQRVHGLLGLEWEAGPHDVLATVLDATAARFSTGPSVATVSLTETWRHTASEAVKLWAGAGPSLAAQRESHTARCDSSALSKPISRARAAALSERVIRSFAS